MKKIALLFILLSLSLYANIGKISAFSGDVKIDRNSQLLNATVGFILEQKDIVKSSDNSKAQVIFEDGTVVSIGKNAVLSIAEYVNDTTNPSNSKTDLRVLEGTFKTITGGIGKVAPEKFKLQTKSASIGIRGTIIVGDQSKVACTQGEITVSAGGVTMIIPAGKMTSISENGTPSQPQDLKENDLTDIDVANDENPNAPTANENEMDSSLDNEEPDNTPPQNNNPEPNVVKEINDSINDDKSKDKIKEDIAIKTDDSKLPSSYSLNGNIINYSYDSVASSFFGTDKVTITPVEFSSIYFNQIKANFNSNYLENDSSYYLIYNTTGSPEWTMMCFNSHCNYSNLTTIIKTGRKGEFVTFLRNTYDEHNYTSDKTLAYYGTTPTMNALESNKIYTYKGFAEMEVGEYISPNLSFGEDFNQTIYLNSTNKSIFVDNQNYINNYEIGRYDNDIAYGSEFNILRLNSNGTITGLYLESDMGSEGYHFGSSSSITGSLYGSTLQGLGLTSTGTNTHNFYPDGTYNQIHSAYLDSVTSTNNTGTLAMKGYLSGFGGYLEDTVYGYSAGGSLDVIYDNNFAFNINQNTGSISSSLINTNWIGTIGIDGSVANLSSYYINKDQFGALIDSFEQTYNGDTYSLDQGWFFSIPDSYDATSNTLSYDLNDDTSWGYWTATLFKDGSNNDFIYNVNHMSTWVAGIETLSSYIPTSGSATFSGHILGSVQEEFGMGNIIPILMNNHNVISGNINFGSTTHNITDGLISFQDGNSNIWKGTFEITDGSGGSFHLNGGITTHADSTMTITHSDLNAKFYGDGAIKTLGGNFNMSGEDPTYNETYTATGVFKAGVQ